MTQKGRSRMIRSAYRAENAIPKAPTITIVIIKKQEEYQDEECKVRKHEKGREEDGQCFLEILLGVSIARQDSVPVPDEA